MNAYIAKIDTTLRRGAKANIITIKTNMLNNMKTPFCAVGVTQTSPNPMF